MWIICTFLSNILFITKNANRHRPVKSVPKGIEFVKINFPLYSLETHWISSIMHCDKRGPLFDVDVLEMHRFEKDDDDVQRLSATCADFSTFLIK